jgi:predicted O-methyltransferase YrrM
MLRAIAPPEPVAMPAKDRWIAAYAAELEAYQRDPAVLDANRAISMWPIEQLAAATALARAASGPMLEIGTYVGGASVALARTGQRLVCMEKGGAHPDHPTLPTDDILRDLKINLNRFGVAERVAIVEGNYGRDENVEQVRKLVQQSASDRILANGKFGLVCIDADGGVDWAFNLFSAFMGPGTLLLIDDYSSVLYGDKAPQTKTSVDRLTELGMIEKWGVVSGQMWVGAVRDVGELAEKKAFVSRVLDVSEIGEAVDDGDPGFIHAIRLPDPWEKHADTIERQASPLILLEDGCVLGPPHYPLEMVRRDGAGSYSHWGSRLYFSSSENSDPRRNGRSYEVVLGKERLRLILT